eukprot:CAMPEP_0117546286 /NCGR_PEP_ID=MMETSP0784-20121206/46529_1 /TAXON_ID=39447 /ORGANISM="" /LENGTH=745 /DNA_ID=CAMNT_0005343153 /DNA_START=1 /DNA_END=2236 /DNA_ORIENTATION=+
MTMVTLLPLLLAGLDYGIALEISGPGFPDSPGEGRVHLGASCGEAPPATWDECRAGNVSAGRVDDSLKSLHECALACASNCPTHCSYVTYVESEAASSCSWFSACDAESGGENVRGTNVSSMLSPCACAQDGVSGGAATGRPGCADHLGTNDFFCYVFDPQLCTHATPSTIFPPAAHRECSPQPSAQVSPGGTCKRAACVWNFYMEGRDWAIHTESYTELPSCKALCLQTPGCTGIEWPVDGSYCAFWYRNLCNVTRGFDNLAYAEFPHDFVTCSFQENDMLPIVETSDPPASTTPPSAETLGPVAGPQRPPANCPLCAFGEFRCPRACSGGMRSFSIDFQYRHTEQSCVEEVPHNGSAISYDADVWCHWLGSRFIVSCENMEKYDFGGLSMLYGCHGGAASDDLVRESCSWICKHRRPQIRCTWNFDSANRHGLRTRLEACWLWEACKEDTIEVLAVCKPKPESLDGPAQQELTVLRSSHEVLQQNLAVLTAELNATQAKLEQERNLMNMSRDNITDFRISHEDAEMNVGLALAELEEAKGRLVATTMDESASALERAAAQAAWDQAMEKWKTAATVSRIAKEALELAITDADDKGARLGQLEDALESTLRELERAEAALAEKNAKRGTRGPSARKEIQLFNLREALLRAEAAEAELERERNSHDMTQSRLRSERAGRENERKGLGVAVAVLVIFIAGMYLIWRLGRRVPQTPIHLVGAESGDLVVGRPVDVGEDHVDNSNFSK